MFILDIVYVQSILFHWSHVGEYLQYIDNIDVIRRIQKCDQSYDFNIIWFYVNYYKPHILSK